MGYRFDKLYWGQGLATEAAIAMRDYAFEQLKLTELISVIHKDNIASKEVAKRIGMTLYLQIYFEGYPVDIFKINSVVPLSAPQGNYNE